MSQRFNHDILFEAEDRDNALRLWPDIANALIDEPLIASFKVPEVGAGRLKRVVQWIGTCSVLIMLISLVLSILSLRSDAQHAGPGGPGTATLQEGLSLLGLVLALLVTRYGPFRRQWLVSRFTGECLRQWHFRRLLDGALVDGCGKVTSTATPWMDQRKTARTAFAQKLKVDGGRYMDRLRKKGDDPLGTLGSCSWPSDPNRRSQLLDAYRSLRIEHQLNYAVGKTESDDSTFAGLSSAALDALSHWLAGGTLFLALALSAVQLAGVSMPTWTTEAGLMLVVGGVSVRAWRDGIALKEEREHFEAMRATYDRLLERWNSASTDSQRLEIAKEVECAATEELRSFLRIHEPAQFLF